MLAVAGSTSGCHQPVDMMLQGQEALLVTHKMSGNGNLRTRILLTTCWRDAGVMLSCQC